MKVLKKLIIATVFISLFYTYNIYAMPKNTNNNEPVHLTPSMETKHADITQNYNWTWLNDESCVQYKGGKSITKERIQRMYDLGALTHWYENDSIKTRDTYSGKWSQDTNGIKSFIFDDYTIPVGPINIDGVIYAFNGYGQLMEGYNYWGDLATGPDGLVVTDNPEFTEWLATQYLPECTSHE